MDKYPYGIPWTYTPETGWYVAKNFKEAEKVLLEYIYSQNIIFPYPDNYYYEMFDCVSRWVGKPTFTQMNREKVIKNIRFKGAR